MSFLYPYPINHFRKYRNQPEVSEGYVINEDTGTIDEATVVYKAQLVEVDTQQFIKTFMDFYAILKDLSSPGVKVLCYIAENIKRNNLSIKLDYEDVAKYCGYKTSRPFYQGVNELISKDVIRKKLKGEYWVNANLFFKGDRKKIVNPFPNE